MCVYIYIHVHGGISAKAERQEASCRQNVEIWRDSFIQGRTHKASPLSLAGDLLMAAIPAG